MDGLQKTTSKSGVIPILALLLVCFALYFNALFGDFVHDDVYQIVENPWVRDIRNIPMIFSKSVWSFHPGQSSNYYRPLMHLVYMFNYYVFGLKPLGFHLINILFHSGASILVFLMLRRLLPERGEVATSSVYLSPPFIAAMLFALHPIHTEAVAWIAALPDVAFSFFYLLSFYLYVLFRNGTNRGYLLSILSFSVSIFFKEPALTLPVLLIAYDYLFKKFDKTLLTGFRMYLPYMAISGVYLLMRYYALRSFAPVKSYAYLNTYKLIINVFPLFQEYVTSLLWPFNLNFWHAFHPINSIVEARGIISIMVVVIFLIVALAAYRKNKIFFFGVLFVVVPLLPVFYIKGISGKPFAERYLYLPSVGYVLLLGIFLSWAREKLPRVAKSIAIAFIVIVGSSYTIGTITRNTVWKDSFILWSDAVKKSPESENARHELGLAAASKGLWDIAITEFQAAIRLDPDHIESHNNLGVAYASKGLLDMEIAEFQTVIRLDPDHAEAHYNLGVAYASKGLLDMAKAECQTAIRLKPDDVYAHYDLAVIYLREGSADLAKRELEAVLKLSPEFTAARRLLNKIDVNRLH